MCVGWVGYERYPVFGSKVQRSGKERERNVVRVAIGKMTEGRYTGGKWVLSGKSGGKR